MIWGWHPPSQLSVTTRIDPHLFGGHPQPQTFFFTLFMGTGGTALDDLSHSSVESLTDIILFILTTRNIFWCMLLIMLGLEIVVSFSVLSL